MTTLDLKDCFPDAIEVIPQALHIVHHGGEVRITGYIGSRETVSMTCSITEYQRIMDFLDGWVQDQQMSCVEKGGEG
jgi:hypothetical protein